MSRSMLIGAVAKQKKGSGKKQRKTESKQRQRLCFSDVIELMKKQKYRVHYDTGKHLPVDKKNELNVEKSKDCYELDELYWFIGRKPRTETR